MYPTDVEVNEAKILKLSSTLKSAYKDIVSEISNATDFGVYNRMAILAQVDAHLTQLGVDVDAFIREELPEYYKRGADDAVTQLRKQGAPLEVTYGFNRVHIEAIEALIDDTAKSFGETLSGISRSANRLLGKTTRDLLTQQIATGMVSGEALKATTKMVKGILQDQGLDALIDKGGHHWTLDRYSEMLLRTKAVEARNRGLINRVAENGYDLVQVSHHFASCDLCAPWEGKILSATGKTKGYPTLDLAESEGLFHPNCRHAINTLIPELAKLTSAYDDKTKTYVVPQSTAVDMAKISGGAVPTDIKFGKFTGQLQPWEKKLADKHELTLTTKALKANMRGQYSMEFTRNVEAPNGLAIKRSLFINEKALSKVPEAIQEKTFKWTLKHEMGHFIDNALAIEQGHHKDFFTRTYQPWRQATRTDVAVVKLTGEKTTISESTAIGRRRLIAGASNDNPEIWDTLTPAQQEDYLAGKVFNIGEPYRDAKGRLLQKQFGVGKRYLNYVYDNDEIFAEAYSWYENDPAGLKKAAPNTFNVIKDLINERIQ